MAETLRGSQEYAAQHKHGVQPPTEPATPETLHQRVAKIERLIELEAGASIDELLKRAQRKPAPLGAMTGEPAQAASPVPTDDTKAETLGNA